MKNNKIIELHNALSRIKNLKGVKVNYAIARTISQTTPLVESLQETINPSEAYQTFDKLRVEIAVKHSKKDEKGNPISINQQYQIEDQEAFDKELNALKEEHPGVLEDRENQIKDFNLFLEEECATNPIHTCTLIDLPEDITTDQMNALMPLIVE